MKHVILSIFAIAVIKTVFSQTYSDYLINTTIDKHKAAMVYGNGYLYLLSANGEKISQSDPNTGITNWTTCYTTTLGSSTNNSFTGLSNRITYIPDGQLIAACGQINGNPGYIIVDNSGNIISESEYSANSGKFMAIMSHGIDQEIVMAGDQDGHPFIARHNGNSNWQVTRDLDGYYMDIDVDEEGQRIFAVGESDGKHLVDIYTLSGTLLESYSLNHWWGTEAEQVEYLGNDKFMVGGPAGQGGFVVMLNVDGTDYWQYGSHFTFYDDTQHQNYDPQVKEIVQTRDGNIVVLWHSFSGTEIYLTKFDWDGNEIWNRRYYDKFTNDGAMDLVSLQNGNLLLLSKEHGNESHISILDEYGHLGERTTCEHDVKLIYRENSSNTTSLTKSISAVATCTTTALTISPCTTLTDQEMCGCWFVYDPWPGRTAYFCNSATLEVPLETGYTYSWSKEDGSALPSFTTSPAPNKRVITPTDDTQPFEITVKIEVTDQNGCVGWDLVNIIITPNGEIPSPYGREVYCYDPQNLYTNLYLPTHHDGNPSWQMTSWYEFQNNPIVNNDIMTDPLLFTTNLPGDPYTVTLKIDDSNFGNCIVQAQHEYVFENCTCNDPITLGEFDGEHSPDNLYGIVVPTSSITKEIHKFRFSMLEDASVPGTTNSWVLNSGVMEEGSTWWGTWFTPILTDKKLHNWGPTIGDNNRDILLEVWYADPSTTIYGPINTCAYEQSILPAWVHSTRKIKEEDEEDENQSSSMENYIEVYPNPSEGNLFINNIPEGSTITLQNIQGQIVYIHKRNDSSNLQLNLTNKLSGIYLLKIIDPIGNIATKKVVFE